MDIEPVRSHLRTQTLAEVAIEFGGLRHGDDTCSCRPDTRTVVIHKEELGLNDRTAEHSAKLVLLERRVGLICRLKEAPRIQGLVAKEFKHWPWKLLVR